MPQIPDVFLTLRTLPAEERWSALERAREWARAYRAALPIREQAAYEVATWTVGVIEGAQLTLGL
jgi:hypothetical protein